MISEGTKQEYYQAMLDKDSGYEGVFYVGVKTTGVFCRPTCTARKPKYENCEFFENAELALLASYRPCKRCRPLSHPNQVSEVIRILVEAVEANPEKRWKTADLAGLGVDASTARRQFQKRFGMTFVEYARARRLGLAMKQIRSGEPVIDAQINAGYESSSGFNDAFARIMGAAPTRFDQHLNLLKAAWIDTKLGPMIAISDEHALYLLEFVDRRGLEREVERLRQRTRSAVVPGMTAPLQSIEQELERYFEGSLQEFQTPVCMQGSPFQMLAWEALQRIPYGETRSYAEMAASIGRPTAYRAIANANGSNQLAIIIPCHRVRNTDGSLAGYAGGVARKKWLIEHEARHAQMQEPAALFAAA
jgi:AraC family transcriptional regulator of adaptative response/methylated-DNA-[protein]-cysteine methyltransferase